MIKRRYFLTGAAALTVSAGVGLLANRPTSAQSRTLTVYSGRGESLIGPLIEQAQQDLGLTIDVRYGDTAELAIAILEEGRNSPADVYFGQDAGALGALAQAGRTQVIPAELISKVDARFRSPGGQWTGITGRARVIAYNTGNVQASELPDSIWDLTSSRWRNRVAWAPTNGSFQAFVTAMRLLEGEDRTQKWLGGMKGNGAQVYRNNTTIVEAIGRGEVDAGLVNNYYLFRFLAEDPNFPVAHHYTRGDAGAMINVAGVAIVDTTAQAANAQRFVEYLLTDGAQQFFAEETKEYPLVTGIAPPEEQLSIDEINPPEIDLGNLADLEGTIAMLQDVGLL